ncbi:hypothetical protein BLA29_011784, partial [Euroglyphus maynei]
VPVPVEKIVKVPYEVIRTVERPYPVERIVKVPQPVAVPVERIVPVVKEVVRDVYIDRPVAVPTVKKIIEPYPVYQQKVLDYKSS